MKLNQVLIVEDDEDISRLIAFHLKKESYDVHEETSGESALDYIYESPPQLILLDLMLPSISGLQICKILKNNPKTAGIPILMVSAKGEENDVVDGLNLGADDYIVKPFRAKELVARVNAAMRRGSSESQDLGDEKSRRFDELTIHPGKREVSVCSEEVSLTFTEFEILKFLSSRPGWVFSRYQIVNAIRGDDYPVTDRSIDVQIVSLRKKLLSAGQQIETVRGIGYRFRNK